VGIARQKGSLSLSLSLSLSEPLIRIRILFSPIRPRLNERGYFPPKERYTRNVYLSCFSRRRCRRVSSSLIQNVFLEGRRVPIGPKSKKPRRLRRPQTNGSLCLSSRSSSCSSRGWHRVKKGEKAHRASSITDTKTYPRLAYGSRGGGRGFRPLVYFGSRRLGQRTRVDVSFRRRFFSIAQRRRDRWTRN